MDNELYLHNRYRALAVVHRTGNSLVGIEYTSLVRYHNAQGKGILFEGKRIVTEDLPDGN